MRIVEGFELYGWLMGYTMLLVGIKPYTQGMIM